MLSVTHVCWIGMFLIIRANILHQDPKHHTITQMTTTSNGTHVYICDSCAFATHQSIQLIKLLCLSLERLYYCMCDQSQNTFIIVVDQITVSVSQFHLYHFSLQMLWWFYAIHFAKHWRCYVEFNFIWFYSCRCYVHTKFNWPLTTDSVSSHCHCAADRSGKRFVRRLRFEVGNYARAHDWFVQQVQKMYFLFRIAAKRYEEAQPSNILLVMSSTNGTHTTGFVSLYVWNLCQDHRFDICPISYHCFIE